MKLTLTRQEILEKFEMPEGTELVIEEMGGIARKTDASVVSSNTITVTFPSMTAKEIMDKYDNKAGSGKLLYSTDWYKNEDFFTTEKTREGTRTIDLDLVLKGSSWTECDAGKGGSEMLTMAEVTYLLATEPSYRNVLKNWNFTWTASRASDGYLVYVGDFDDVGAYVYRLTPGHRNGHLGVSFSRRT